MNNLLDFIVLLINIINMGAVDKNKLGIVKELYYKRLFPMKKVAESLGVSLDSIVYFMRKNNLKRRTLKEDSVVRFAKKPLSFKLKKVLSEDEKSLKIIGVTLYWGEGYKSVKSAGIDLANSDVDIILQFLLFLRKICGIDEKRLRVLLYCHANQNQKKLIEFWSRKTKISKGQFTKPYVRKDGNYDSIRTMPYGLVHIRYADKKLLSVVKNWIEEIKAV